MKQPFDDGIFLWKFLFELKNYHDFVSLLLKNRSLALMTCIDISYMVGSGKKCFLISDCMVGLTGPNPRQSFGSQVIKINYNEEILPIIFPPST